MREPNLKYLALENMARLAEVPAVVDTGGWGNAHLGWLGRAVGDVARHPLLNAVHPAIRTST